MKYSSLAQQIIHVMFFRLLINKKPSISSFIAECSYFYNILFFIQKCLILYLLMIRLDGDVCHSQRSIFPYGLQKLTSR